MAAEGLYHLTHEPTVPATGAAPLLVLIHGYGSNEEDLMGLVPYLDGRFRAVSVRAPQPLDQGGYCWYPVEFTPSGLVVGYDQAAASVRRLAALIASLQQRYAIDGSSTYLLGFSQGAAMALSVAFDSPSGSAAVACLSGVCVPEMVPRNEEAVSALRSKPVFMAHGTADPLIPIGQGRDSHQLLQSLSLDLIYREYDMGHEINQACLADLSAWLQERLADRPR